MQADIDAAVEKVDQLVAGKAKQTAADGACILCFAGRVEADVVNITVAVEQPDKPATKTSEIPPRSDPGAASTIASTESREIDQTTEAKASVPGSENPTKLVVTGSNVSANQVCMTNLRLTR